MPHEEQAVTTDRSWASLGQPSADPTLTSRVQGQARGTTIATVGTRGADIFGYSRHNDFHRFGVQMRIHLSRATVGPTEEAYVLDALRSGWVAPLGPHVDAFEREVASRIGVEHAVALASGTAALHLALLGTGVGPGTYVLVPSMTFAASANAVLYTGATPAFVDSRSADGNVDVELVSKAARTLSATGKRVSALMSVDLFGKMAPNEELEELAQTLQVPLIEDAAESLGAQRQGRQAGSFGRVAALSFNGNKIITSSGGGMLLTNDTGIAALSRKLSTQAREPVPWYEHRDMGFNYRMSNILAALARAQLTRLDDFIARRRQIRTLYGQLLSDIPGVRLLSKEAAADDNCWLTCLLIDSEITGVTASSLIEHLGRRDIEARHLWKPMHLQPLFRDAPNFVNGTSERLFAAGVALPSGSDLTDDQVVEVSETIRQVVLRAT